MIAKLRANGYRFVTIPELLQQASIPAQPPVAQGAPTSQPITSGNS